MFNSERIEELERTVRDLRSMLIESKHNSHRLSQKVDALAKELRIELLFIPAHDGTYYAAKGA